MVRLTEAERRVLATLKGDEAASVIAERLGLAWPHGNWITTTLRRLSRRGLVERTWHELDNPPGETFRITSAGRAALGTKVDVP